jgi:hypothetical protein
LLAAFADKLIYRRHLFSSLRLFLARAVDFDAQKAAYLPLSGTTGLSRVELSGSTFVRQSAQAAALLS